MGYFIQAHGFVSFDKAQEIRAVIAAKNLNHDHDAKRGGSFGGAASTNPYESRWYSWMPPRYHEDDSIQTVQHILEMLGFDVTEAVDGNVTTLHVTYDNKTGQEEVFLNALADYARISINVEGEDGSKWIWSNVQAGSPLMYAEASDPVYITRGTVAEMITKEKAILDRINKQYA